MIRDAVPGDEPQLAAMTAAIQALHVAERPDVFKTATVADFERLFAERLEEATSQILVAETAGVVVGHAVTTDEHRGENVYVYARRWCEIQQIGVRPEYRRRGIASSLIRHIVASARARGIGAVELNAWTFNETARVAFQRLGFVMKDIRHELSGPKYRSGS